MDDILKIEWNEVTIPENWWQLMFIMNRKVRDLYERNFDSDTDITKGITAFSNIAHGIRDC